MPHNTNHIPFVPRQLVVNLEGTEGVDIIPEEIDTEGILTAEAIDIEDSTTLGKLTGFVDIVYLLVQLSTTFRNMLCVTLNPSTSLKLYVCHGKLGGYRMQVRWRELWFLFLFLYSTQQLP